MAETSIEWATHSWNLVVGCSLVSPGCTNCYAMSQADRIERMAAGAGKPTHYAGLTQASKAGPVWTGRLAAAPDHIWWEPVRAKKPREYFVNSMGDLFHENVPDAWIDRAFAVMAMAGQHTFIVLTKRAERMRRYMTEAGSSPGMNRLAHAMHAEERALPWELSRAYLSRGNNRLTVACGPNREDEIYKFVQWPFPNVVLGVSVEDQARADERVPHLLATPAATRIISAEPLLGPVDLDAVAYNDGELDSLRGDLWGGSGTGAFDRGIDGVIVGGESGRDARPMHPDWARSLRDTCAAADVDFFFKQWGSWRPSFESRGDGPQMLTRWVYPMLGSECGGALMAHLPRSKTGRLLDGRTHDALPWRKQET